MQQTCGGVVGQSGSFRLARAHASGLAQIHAEAVDAIVETKRAESIGQYDLFGGAEAAESGQSSAFGLDMAIPVGEWDKTTLLANEREMLGLYVSDHPLNGVESTLRAATDCSIAAMYTDEVTDGRVVTVGGLVTGVARKVTKRGDTWAIVSLEDLDASVEVMVFPKAYSLMGPYCSQDAVLLVRGRVDLSDENELKFIAMDITIPDLTSSHDGPVVLSVPASRIVEPVVARLNEILATHPGTTEVRLEVKHGSRTTVMRLDDSKRVTVSPSLFADLGTTRTVLFVGCRFGRPNSLMSESARSSTWRAGVRVALPILAICVVLGALMGIAWNLLAPPNRTVCQGRQCGVRPGDRSSSRCRPHLCLPRHRMWTACVGIHRGQVALGWGGTPDCCGAWGVIGSVIAWRIGLVLAGNSAGTGTADLSAAGRAEGVALKVP